MPRAWCRGRWKAIVEGSQCQYCEVRKFSRTGHKGCTMQVLSAPLTAYLQRINMVNYAMCVIPQLNMLTRELVQDCNPIALGAEPVRSAQVQARLVYSKIQVIEG